MSTDDRKHGNWVTGEGGALDRTMLIACALLVLSSGFMTVVTARASAWGSAVFWAVVAVGAVAALWHFGGRVRRTGL